MTDLSKLTGAVRTMRPQSSNPYGIPWQNIARYAAFIDKAAQRYGAEPERIAAHIVIESDGEPDAVQKNASNGWSYGLMQVVPYGVGWAGWHRRVEVIAGLTNLTEPNVVNALYDPRINILVGTSILADFKAQYGSWDKASSAFFTGGPNWGGSDTVNGTTGRAYRDTLSSLMAEIRNQTKPGAENQTHTTTGLNDPIAVIVGGAYPPITYGWLADAGLNYYVYGVNHGTQRATQHTGVDVPVPDETPLYAPFAGKVLCVGNAGQNTWGQGCGAYNDTMGGGVGNITILGDTGYKLTLGHCSAADVSVGQRVQAGQRVGRSGGMNGYHVHVEMAVQRNGTYWLLEPIAALKEAMGAGTVTPQPTYDAPRIDVPQPGAFDAGWAVAVLRDNTPVKQYASRDAPDVTAPLKKGETFTAVYIAYGRDGEPWWISDRRGRVPVAGTKCDALAGVL